MSKKALGLWRLFRFELPLTAGVCVIFGQMLALGTFPPGGTALTGFGAVFLLSAAALIINDVFDLESDRINAPGRPLPAGLVTPREVIALFAAVTILGLFASAWLGLTALLVGLFVWLVGFLYNWRLKKAGLWGNLLVSFSVGMTFVFGAISTGRIFAPAAWFFGVLALLINLGEEIAADAMDVEGDRRAGSRSLPIVLGGENALRISAGIFGLVCLISPLPFLLGWMEWALLAPILGMDAIILYSTLKLLDGRQANRRMYIRWIYLGALAAILAVIFIKFLN